MQANVPRGKPRFDGSMIMFLLIVWNLWVVDTTAEG